MLQKIDAFGYQPQLYINSKEKLKSKSGGLLTIIFCMCFFVSCWIYGKDMLYKQNPTIIFSEQPQDHPENFVINQETFNFSVGLQGYDKKNYFDESIYTLKLFLLSQDNNELNWTPIKVKQCDKNSFQIAKDYFLNNSQNFNMYCIDYDQNQNISIEGIWGSDGFKAIVGKIFPCQDSKENKIKCQKQEKIYETLTDNQFSINYTDQVINPKNYTNPFQSIGKNSYGLASWDTYRVNNYYFSNVYLEDDTGVIYEQRQTKRNLQFINEKEMTKYGQHQDKVFLEFYIRMQSSKDIKYYRQYLNFAEVVANVGGILKILVIFFTLISWYMCKQLSTLKLVNETYQFKNLNLKKNDKQQNYNAIEFSSIFFLYFPFFTKQQRRLKIAMDYAMQKVTRKLSQNYIIKKFQELDNLQNQILDRENNDSDNKSDLSRSEINQKNKQLIDVNKILNYKKNRQLRYNPEQNPSIEFNLNSRRNLRHNNEVVVNIENLQSHRISANNSLLLKHQFKNVNDQYCQQTQSNSKNQIISHQTLQNINSKQNLDKDNQQQIIFAKQDNFNQKMGYNSQIQIEQQEDFQGNTFQQEKNQDSKQKSLQKDNLYQDDECISQKSPFFGSIQNSKSNDNLFKLEKNLSLSQKLEVLDKGEQFQKQFIQQSPQTPQTPQTIQSNMRRRSTHCPNNNDKIIDSTYNQYNNSNSNNNPDNNLKSYQNKNIENQNYNNSNSNSFGNEQQSSRIFVGEDDTFNFKQHVSQKISSYHGLSSVIQKSNQQMEQSKSNKINDFNICLSNSQNQQQLNNNNFQQKDKVIENEQQKNKVNTQNIQKYQNYRKKSRPQKAYNLPQSNIEIDKKVIQYNKEGMGLSKFVKKSQISKQNSNGSQNQVLIDGTLTNRSQNITESTNSNISKNNQNQKQD